MSETQWQAHHWTDNEGMPDGGVSYGVGFTIAWQRGSLLKNGRNGAFLIEVLEACLDELKNKHKQFPCQENVEAIFNLTDCIDVLKSRLERRKQEGILYDHKESAPYPKQ